MYQALDEFLAANTWATLHPLDMERFFVGLDKIIHRPEFNSTDMGEYLDEKYEERFGHPSDAIDGVVDKLVGIAYNIQRYLEVTGQRTRQD